jgi:predicted RNase H-like HicB family nuclease
MYYLNYNNIHFKLKGKLLRDQMLTVKEYMKLPYNYIVKPITDQSGAYYYATVLELDGCQSTGETFEEAYNSLLEAMEGWIETKLDNNYPIPEPVSPEQFSGKFIVRLPKSLHYKLTLEAEREGVSLNQYALYKLSR